jgi:uncharacterized protein (TIGR04255 family)
MSHSFPDFGHPPVVEVVLGVQFSSPQGITGAHMGKFWTELGKDWPKITEALPIPDQFETFNKIPQFLPPGTPLLIPRPLGSRFQITNAAGDRMIQVQSTRFHYNWQKASGKYPRYDKVREEFNAFFGQFQSFVRREGLGELLANQWEVTYIDFIRPGELWTEPNEWSKILPGLFGFSRAQDQLRLESITGEWHYEISPQLGRLHIAPAMGKVASSEELGLILSITARGPIGHDVPLDLDRGLDLGHKMIVQTFLDISSQEAQRAWGRKGL